MNADAVVWTSVLSTISLTISIIVAFFYMGTRWAKMAAKMDMVEWRLRRLERLFRLRYIADNTEDKEND